MVIVRVRWFVIFTIAIFSLIPFLDANAQTVPSQPTDLVAFDVADDQIDLFWTTPNDDGGSVITGYKIELVMIVPGQTTPSAIVDNTSNTDTSYSHTGLQKDKTYVYQVYAINSEGESLHSPQAQAKPTENSAPFEDIPPDPPSGLTATDVSPNQIDLSWNKPTANKGPLVTGYKIEVKIGSGSFTFLEPDTGNTARTYSDTGLTTGTTYTYRVYALNSIGQSNSTSEASATPTSTSAPPEGTEKPGIPRNFKALAASDTEISLSWEPPATFDGPSVTGYKIEFKTGTEDFTDLVDNTALTSYLHSGLTPGTTYTYRISAINSNGAGLTAQSSAEPEHTSVPTNLVATDVSPTQIDLSWNAPSQTFGFNIIGYNIEKKLAEGVYDLILQTSGPAASVSFQNLETDKTYTFRIAARFGLGSSAFSDDVSATPTESSGITETVPSPPTQLTITHDAPTVNNLSWGTPEDDGGKPITGYKIELKVDVGDWEIVKANTGSTSTIYSHTNIPSGTDYNYRVSAINSIGTGLGNSKSIRISEEVPESQLIEVSTDKSSYLEGEEIVVTGKVSSVDDNQVTITVFFDGAPITDKPKQVAQDGTFTATIPAIGPTWQKNGVYILKATYGLASGQTNFQFTLTGQPEPEPEPETKKAADFFIDTKNEPEYYLERYNKDADYKAWFDSTFPGYTIEEAISLAYPQPEAEPEPEPEPKAEPKPILDFVDPNKDPQYYIDRYNNQAVYKQWFDSTYPDYTIEEAVGLALPEPEPEPEPKKEAKPILDFVDPNEDPQYYIDRYNSEATYKAWFDRTYPDYTIQEAVGLGTSEEDLAKKCGPGTVLKNGECVVEKTSGGGGCLIATAAFGSELAPQVQFLREIRDNTVLNTQSGTSFMMGFNQFYYSFSPIIADWERENPVFKEAVKVTITPLLMSLSLLDHAEINSEEEMLGYGISLILVNIGMYVAVPVVGILKLRKLKFNRTKI